MKPKLMKTIQVYEYGDIDVLKYEEVIVPVPNEKEVLVRVYASAVLPIEWKIRKGLFKSFFPVSFPYTPGSSFSGEVIAVGESVKEYEIGQFVFGRSTKGTYTEYLTISEKELIPLPNGLSFEDAVTISGGAATAWNALITEGHIKSGQKVLIHGAAGGVGQYAIQIAKQIGAEVIGTASTKNIEFVKNLGANQVIDYTKTQFENELNEVDFVFDTVGGKTLERSWSVVKPGGKIVSIVEIPNAKKAEQLGVQAIKPSQLPSKEVFSKIANLIAQKKYKSTIFKRFSLHEAREAHKLSETGHGTGRIILKMNDTYKQ
ncbi:NADP-dependent oxidoreductase [Bacillus sp. OAE603]|uniref:NADP-dependent oxidoreductase n=1 Tax=Gottfriedia sp. OAE603 TaxID=2663872 RepID=UPI00178C113C